MTPRK